MSRNEHITTIKGADYGLDLQGERAGYEGIAGERDGEAGCLMRGKRKEKGSITGGCNVML